MNSRQKDIYDLLIHHCTVTILEREKGSLTIGSRAVVAGGHLPTLLVDLLGNALPGLRRESGSLQEVQEHLTVHHSQQNPAACLTDR